MAFCGQCGFLLPPKVSTCPHCGITVTLVGESEGQNAHDPTIASLGQVPPVQTPAKQPPRRTFLIAGLATGLTALGGGIARLMIPRQIPCVPAPPIGSIASNGLITPGVLSWGADPSPPGAPYVFLDANSDLVGFEVDIANAITQLMGITQECYQTNYKWKIEQDLQARTMDIILNGWEITSGRELDESFSEPYYRYSQQLVVRANDRRFSKYTDQSQITLAELKPYNYKWGTGSDYKAADLLRAAGITPYTSNDPLSDLNRGIVDIVMIDMPMVIYYVEGKGLVGATPSHTLRAIGQPMFTDSTSNYVIGFKKNEPNAGPNANILLQEINQALLALKQDGTLKGIYQQWGLWNDFQKDIGIIDCS